MDQNKLALLILIDVSKALDTLDHSLLLALLHYYGFMPSATKFIKNNLNNKNQRVCVGDRTSSLDILKSGVPQGSVLGPLLFCLYVADFSKKLNFCHIHQYADDICSLWRKMLYHPWTQLIKIFLDNASNHAFVLNFNKSKIILFGNTFNEKARNILKLRLVVQLQGTTLQFTESLYKLYNSVQ